MELEDFRRTRWQGIPWAEETFEAWYKQWEDRYYALPLAKQKAAILAQWGVRGGPV